MIPSDHFVRFYNEIFKYLDRLGGEHLNNYWLEVSRTQEKLTLDLFLEKGLQGMYEYWEKIRIEENCDMTLDLRDNYLELQMKKCPSLSKVMDNDAEPCFKYCDHCIGWIGPLLRKAGAFCICDMHDRRKPTCSIRIFKDESEARTYHAKITADNDSDLIKCNF